MKKAMGEIGKFENPAYDKLGILETKDTGEKDWEMNSGRIFQKHEP